MSHKMIYYTNRIMDGFLIILMMTSSASLVTNEEIDTEILPLLMPNVRPNTDNLYLCHGVNVARDKSLFITKFEPLDKNHAAHHMLLYGCEEPGSPEEVWKCGEMASSKVEGGTSNSPCKSKPSILYAWAHNAPELQLPKGTGFKIGAGSKIKSLVLQIHYAHVDKFRGSPLTDNSGFQLTLTDKKLPREAGVLLMVSGGSIPPKSQESMEVACEISENVKLHPFAFRTHTHKLGRLVSGYVIKKTGWVRIGEKSPQLEQMFYPVDNNVTIEKHDVLAARCIMENNGTKEVFVGPTMDDEMCNFYIMYYYDAPSSGSGLFRMRDHSNKISEEQCYSPGPPFWYWKYADIRMPEELGPEIVQELPKRNDAIYASNNDAEGIESMRNDDLEQELEGLKNLSEPENYDYTI